MKRGTGAGRPQRAPEVESGLEPGISLPRTAWSPAFALFLVFGTVEILLLVYLQMLCGHALGGDFLMYQWFVDVWTAGGRLARGLPFEVMKVNVLLALHLWAAARGMPPRAGALPRFALAGAALALAGLQVLLVMTTRLTRPPFALIRLVQ